MNEQPYTPTNLRRRISFTDKCKNEELHDPKNRNKIGEEAFLKITKGLAFSSGLRQFRLGKKLGYGFTEISDTVIARQLANNLRTAYPITQSNRQFLISNTVSIMKECLAYHVFRYDIQTFYESIDRKLLLERIITDGICTWQTVLLLQRLFDILDIYEISGLPRGLAVSGALAELRLLPFDQTIRHNNDVFFYGRFVDDVLVITSERMKQAVFDDIVMEALPEELNLHNGEKRSFISVPAIHTAKKKNDPVQKFFPFSYLGYKIEISNNTTKGVALGTPLRDVLVDISHNKIQKLQDRLIKSFTNFISSKRRPQDFKLLKNRIRAITGNYEVRDPSTKVAIRTGIYYSYIHKNSDSDCALMKLDRFYRGLMFSNQSMLSIRIRNSVSLNRRKMLIGYSFTAGFHEKRFHSFSYKSFEQIKKVWL